MQIYSKSTKNATSLFLGPFWFCLFYLIGLGGGFKLLHRILKFINYANLCKFIQNQQKMLLFCHFLADLILYVLSDRAWCGLQNFYTEIWKSLIMQIYANFFKSMKNALQICTSGGDVYYASRNLLSTCLIGHDHSDLFTIFIFLILCIRSVLLFAATLLCTRSSFLDSPMIKDNMEYLQHDYM